MLLFAAGTMNFFMVRSRFYESIALLVAAFVLFQPGYILNQFQPEFETRPGSELFSMAQAAPDDASLRVRLVGENLNGDPVDAKYLLPVGAAGEDGAARLLAGSGIEFREEDGRILVDNLSFGGPAEQLGIDWDWELVELDVPASRLPKEIFYIPALLLVLGVYLLQMRRKPAEAHGMTKHILCAVDLTHMDDARAIVAEAGRLAAFEGAGLSLVTALPDYGMSFVGSFFKEGTLKEATQSANTALHDLAAKTLPDREQVQCIVGIGNAYEEVLSAARKCGADHIIVGAHKPDLADRITGAERRADRATCACDRDGGAVVRR